MSKPTPGPWRIGKGDPDKENYVANVRGIDIWGPRSVVRCIDDAHLIAAAPDLLEALEELYGRSLLFGWYGCEEMLKAESAIRKAKGE